jgi:hypothetical protein
MTKTSLAGLVVGALLWGLLAGGLGLVLGLLAGAGWAAASWDSDRAEAERRAQPVLLPQLQPGDVREPAWFPFERLAFTLADSPLAAWDSRGALVPASGSLLRRVPHGHA